MLLNKVKKYWVWGLIFCFLIVAGYRIIIKPTAAETYFNKAKQEDNSGLYNEALKDYDKAIKLQPDYAKAYFNRGSCKASLIYDKNFKDKNNTKEKYKKAIKEASKESLKDYDKAIKLQPDYTEAYYARGFAKCKLGQYEEAKKDFHKAKKLDHSFLKYFITNSC